MSQKPESLDEIWTEQELCGKLGLPIGKGGHSRQLSNWVRGGLKYAEKSGKRYFFEGDVIEYLAARRDRQ